MSLLADATVEALRENQIAAATRSDDRGRYELSLRSGAYLIRAKGPGRFVSRSPRTEVTLSAGEHLTVTFDLGATIGVASASSGYYRW